MNADMRVSEKKTFEIGGLSFTVLHRELGEKYGADGGVSIEIYGDVDGEKTQVLRFDCFRKQPHYHMPPSAPGQLSLDPKEVGTGLDWSFDQIREHLPEMIQTAGFTELAKAVDRHELHAKAVEQVQTAISQTAKSI